MSQAPVPLFFSQVSYEVASDSSADASSSHSSDGGHHGPSAEALVIFFLFIGLLLGGFLREFNKKTGFPYTPMLFMLGMMFGYWNGALGMFGQSVLTISDIDPHGILLIFLPTLIFESGFNADWHLFKRQFVQIFILAVPCVFLSALFLAFCVKVIVGYDNEYYTWSGAFMFGSILSCTDTVAVLSLLKEVGAAKKFNSLIEGESLINDASSMLLMQLSADIVKGKSKAPLEIVGTFFSLTIGGTILGIIFGILSSIWIRKIFNDDVLVVNVTFLTCYLLFFVAENVDLGIRISGIIALVALGLFMAAFGKTRINAESEHAVHTFWKYIVYCAETIIFLLAGVIIGVHVILGEHRDADAIPLETSDILRLLVLYVCMMIVRYLVISIFMPILTKHGYGLTWRDVFILTYGGLRGAIGIAFALIVTHDTEYDATLRQLVLFDMAGCAVLTLIINATTAGYWVRKMGLASTSIVKKKVYVGFLENFIGEIQKYAAKLKEINYLKGAVLETISKKVGIQNYQELIDTTNREIEFKPQADAVDKFIEDAGKFVSQFNRPEQRSEESIKRESIYQSRTDYHAMHDDDSEKNMKSEIRNRFLLTLKEEYFHLLHESQCSPDAYILLLESVNWDMDNADFNPMNSWDYIENYFVNQKYINFMSSLTNFPLIGGFANRAVFKQLSFVYDVVSCYGIAHEHVEHSLHEYSYVEEQIIKSIIEESKKNRHQAEEYLNKNIIITYPEIMSAIQSKRAAHSLLIKQRDFVLEKFNHGQIDDKEFKQLKKEIDYFAFTLSERSFTWVKKSPTEFVKTLPLFEFFSDDEIRELVGPEETFKRGDDVIKEHSPVTNIYVLLKGICTHSILESANAFREKNERGTILTYYSIVNPNKVHESDVLADSFVTVIPLNLKKLQKKVKDDEEVEQFIWKEALYFIIKRYPELHNLANLERKDMHSIYPHLVFKRYSENSIIDFSKGGILLAGEAVEYNDNPEKNLLGVPKLEGMRRFKNIDLITPTNNFRVRCVTDCSVFHFKENFYSNFTTELLTRSDRESGRSMSFIKAAKASISRPSIAKPSVIAFKGLNRLSVSLKPRDTEPEESKAHG